MHLRSRLLIYKIIPRIYTENKLIAKKGSESNQRPGLKANKDE